MIELILLSTTVKTASKNSKRFKSYRSFKIGFQLVPWFHYLKNSYVPH